MKIIIIDRTQRSIRVQTYDITLGKVICSLPHEVTKVTPSLTKVKLADKIIFFLFTNFSATYSFLLCCINIIIIDYNRLIHV